MWQLVLLFSLLSSRRHVHGASVTTASWRADNITTSFSGVQYVGPWYVSFQTHSNRPIYTGDGGHISFTVNFTLYNETVYSATTGCFTLGTPAKDLTALLNGAVVSSNFSSNGTAATYLLKDFFTIDAKKDYQLSHVKKNNNTNIVSAYKATFSSPQVLYLSASMHQVGCNAARTLGEWTDYYNWVNGVVPSNSSFNVVIPANSGLIQIAQNVTVNRFTMAGGHLLLHAPGCPQGWSAAPGTFRALKCYRLEDELLDFDTAEKKCRNTGKFLTIYPSFYSWCNTEIRTLFSDLYLYIILPLLTVITLLSQGRALSMPTWCTLTTTRKTMLSSGYVVATAASMTTPAPTAAGSA